MWRGLYTAGVGMMTQMNRTSVIANNLANAATSGFKRDRVVDEEFGPMLIRRINDGDPNGDITRIKQFHVGDTIPPVVGNLGLGAKTAEIVTDLSQGSMQDTGNQLDLAIAGSGFFAVATPRGALYPGRQLYPGGKRGYYEPPGRKGPEPAGPGDKYSRRGYADCRRP